MESSLFLQKNQRITQKKWYGLFIEIFGKEIVERYFLEVTFELNNSYLSLDFKELTNAIYVQSNHYDAIALIANKLLNNESSAVKITCNKQPLPNKPLIVVDDKNKVICHEKLVFNNNFSFDSFIVDDSNLMAFKLAQNVSVRKNVKNNGTITLFVGDSGVGKTHLLRAIYRQNYENGNEVCFFSGERFAANFVSSIRSNTSLDFKNSIIKSNILIIDDVDFLLGKVATINEFENIVHNMLVDGKEVILSGHKNKKEYLDKIPKRLQYLFEESLMIDIKPHTSGIKKSFCHNFIKDREINIDPSALNELLQMAPNLSLQNIKGILNKCYAVANFEHNIISKTVIKGIIKSECNCDLFENNLDPQQQKMNDIIMKVASLYNVSYDDVIGTKRCYNTTVARKISIYLIRLITTMTYKQIGNVFNKRNHSTIIQLKTQIDEEIEQDETLKFAIQKLARMILKKNYL